MAVAVSSAVRVAMTVVAVTTARVRCCSLDANRVHLLDLVLLKALCKEEQD